MKKTAPFPVQFFSSRNMRASPRRVRSRRSNMGQSPNSGACQSASVKPQVVPVEVRATVAVHSDQEIDVMDPGGCNLQLSVQGSQYSALRLADEMTTYT